VGRLEDFVITRDAGAKQHEDDRCGIKQSLEQCIDIQQSLVNAVKCLLESVTGPYHLGNENSMQISTQN
jgi:hypothetical protein